MRARVLTLASVVLALGYDALGQRTPREPAQQSAQLRIVRASEGWRLRLEGTGHTLELDGVEYAQTGSRGELQRRTLRFAHAERERQGASWLLVGRGEPRVRLRISEALAPLGERPSANGLVARVDGYDVELELALGIPRRVRHVALRWRVVGAGAKLTQRILPFRCRDELDVAPQTSFATPLCIAGDAKSAWVSLRPKERSGTTRLPSYVAFVPRQGQDPATLVHGLGEAARRGARAFGLRSHDERQRGLMRLSHRIALHPAQPIDRLVGSLARSSWRESHEPAKPRAKKLRRRLDEALARAAKLLRPIGDGKSVLAANAAELESGIWNLEESRESRPLAAALAIHRWAQEHNDAKTVELARGVLRLFLSAPGSSGLFATRAQVELRPRGGGPPRAEWRIDDRTGYSTQDCARCATWWLRWAAVDPELRAACLSRAERLGEFFLRNQHADGTWPARFRRNVVPVRDQLYSTSIESASIARFLLALDKSVPDERWLKAAERTMRGLEERIAKARFVRRGSLGADYQAQDSASLALPTRTLLDASLLCMEHPRADVALGQRFLDFVLPMQRPVLGPKREAGAGGLLRSNEEALRCDLACSEAAAAFAKCWAKTGEAQMLERAAAALRAPFGLEPLDASTSLVPLDRPDSSLGGLVTIAVWVDDFLLEYGDALVDLSKGIAIGFEQVEIELLAADEDPAIRLETNGPALPTRVRFVGGERRDRRLSCNGELLGPFSPAERERGLELIARRRIALSFAPPRLQRRLRDLEFRAELSTAIAGARLRVELAAGPARRSLDAVSLAPDEDEPRRFRGTLAHARLPSETTLWARAAMLHPRRVVSEWRRITLGDWGIADCGDDDERWLVAARGVRAASIASDEGAQRLESGGELVYELPIDARALRVELSLRAAGDDGELALADGARHRIAPRRDEAVSTHRVILHNRELWSAGRLRIGLRSARGIAIGEVRFREVGSASSATDVGALIESAKLRRIEILALPCTTQRASRHERESLGLALFADDDYRSAPGEPEVATEGSLASWLRALSRDALTVEGTVATWRSLDLHGVTSQKQLLARLRTAHRTFLDRPKATRASSRDARVVLVLHTGLPARLAQLAASSSSFVDGRPLVFARAVDEHGQLLPLGSIAEAILCAIDPELPPATSLDGGALGALVLGPASAGPLPPPPLGLRLARLGWVPTYRARLGRLTGLRIPTIDEGFVLELPCSGLPARGRVLIERRPHSDLDAWSDGGLLGYWDLGNAARTPRAATRDASARARVRLRSIASRRVLNPRLLPTHDWTPLLTETKLVAAPLASGELVTAHGERVWQLDVPPAKQDPNEGPGLTAESLGRPLLTGTVAFSARHPTSRSFVSIAAGASASETGSVQEHARARLGRASIRLPHGIGSRARLDFGAVDLTTGARLCGRVRGAGLRLDCIVVSGGHERRIVAARLDASSRRFVFTLPALGAAGTPELRLEAIALVDDPTTLELEAPVLWPTTRALLDVFEFSPRAVVREALRLRDGSLRGPHVRLDAGTRLELPVSLRSGARLRLEASTDPQARQALRLSASFRPARASEVIRLVPGVEIHSRDNCQLQVVDLGEVLTRAGHLILERDDNGPPLFLTLASLRVR